MQSPSKKPSGKNRAGRAKKSAGSKEPGMGAKAASRETPTKILIADDDRTTRLFLSEIMKTAGYAVTVASDGKEALKKLKKGKFDLVLLDVWMPNMNGIEVLTALRQEAAPPKVVIMTTDGTPETVLKAIREQAFRYMKKPIDPDALIDTVQQAIAAKPETLPIEVISARPRSGRARGALPARSKNGSARRNAPLHRNRIPRAAFERGGMGRQARSQSQSPNFLRARGSHGDV